MTHLPARSTRRRIAAVSSVCLTAALIGIAPSAWATEATPPIAASALVTGVTSFAVSPEAATAAVAHWTPERRAAAVDADGAAGSVPTADDALAASAASTVSVAEQVAPVPHIGRLFFERDGKSYFCSANVVQAANRSTIATAGHCETERQEFSTNVVFVPGYDDGASPYGVWPVVGGNVTTGWFQRNDQDQAEDTSFLAVGRNDDGADVQSVVGASVVRFDGQAAQQVGMYGYPGEGRFDGSELQRCSGVGDVYTEMQIDLGCDMTGGISGGPIFLGDGPDGVQFANVAERAVDGVHNIGPVWRDAAHSAYDLTAAIAV